MDPERTERTESTENGNRVERMLGALGKILRDSSQSLFGEKTEVPVPQLEGNGEEKEGEKEGEKEEEEGEKEEKEEEKEEKAPLGAGDEGETTAESSNKKQRLSEAVTPENRPKPVLKAPKLMPKPRILPRVAYADFWGGVVRVGALEDEKGREYSVEKLLVELIDKHEGKPTVKDWIAGLARQGCIYVRFEVVDRFEDFEFLHRNFLAALEAFSGKPGVNHIDVEFVLPFSEDYMRDVKAIADSFTRFVREKSYNQDYSLHPIYAHSTLRLGYGEHPTLTGVRYYNAYARAYVNNHFRSPVTVVIPRNWPTPSCDPLWGVHSVLDNCRVVFLTERSLISWSRDWFCDPPSREEQVDIWHESIAEAVKQAPRRVAVLRLTHNVVNLELGKQKPVNFLDCCCQAGDFDRDAIGAFDHIEIQLHLTFDVHYKEQALDSTAFAVEIAHVLTGILKTLLVLFPKQKTNKLKSVQVFVTSFVSSAASISIGNLQTLQQWEQQMAVYGDQSAEINRSVLIGALCSCFNRDTQVILPAPYASVMALFTGTFKKHAFGLSVMRTSSLVEFVDCIYASAAGSQSTKQDCGLSPRNLSYELNHAVIEREEENDDEPDENRAN